VIDGCFVHNCALSHCGCQIIEEKEPLVAMRACPCHDSHGIAVDEEGTITETYKVSRCKAHRDRPSIYTKLN